VAYVPDEQDLAWARALVREHVMTFDEALRRATLPARIPRLDRLLAERFAGAEYRDTHDSYHLWLTGPLDDAVVGFVADRMREAGVAETEWALHAARFSRRRLQAAHDAISPHVRDAAPGVVQMTTTDYRSGTVVAGVRRGTPPEVKARIRAVVSPGGVPLDVIEVDEITAVAGGVSIASIAKR
jgi:hypothetical protein